MTRLRAIGIHLHDHFETYGVFAVWMSAVAVSSIDAATGNVVFLAGCTAYVLGARILDRCCVRWCREEFERLRIDFDAVGNSSL